MNKHFIFRFDIKDDFARAIRFVNFLEAFNIDYQIDLEDVGTEKEITSFLLYIEIYGLKRTIDDLPDFNNEEVPF